MQFHLETFEKCQFLLKFKEGDNFNHPGEISLRISQGRQEYIEYFEDYNLSPMQKLGKKGCFAKVSPLLRPLN